MLEVKRSRKFAVVEERITGILGSTDVFLIAFVLVLLRCL
jgi:hypothetical protein